MCLVDTRGNSDLVDQFCMKASLELGLAAILAEGYFGGILVTWNKLLGQVTPIAVFRRDLHMIIFSDLFMNLIISVVYNVSCFQIQRSLWHELSKVSFLNLH